MPKRSRLDLVGQRFGRLTVRHEVDPYVAPGGKSTRRWYCECHCGGSKTVTQNGLRYAKSCGCLKQENGVIQGRKRVVHGHRQSNSTAEYNAWRGARSRCYCTSDPKYNYYGGRGISMCPEWDSFQQFLADMGPRPSAKHSLDRIDTNGPYSPTNCRWATAKEQIRNRRNTVFVEHKGSQVTLGELAERTGIGYSTLNWRHRHGNDLIKET